MDAKRKKKNIEENYYSYIRYISSTKEDKQGQAMKHGVKKSKGEFI